MPADDAGIMMIRLTYPPGAVFEGKSSGLVVYYVEKGSLAIPDALETAKVIDYSGPESNPPRRRLTEAGETVFPAGYAIVFEDGTVGTTRNPDNEPTVVLMMAL